MIDIQDITKIYRGKTVLDQVSLSLEAGKTHVLLGQSGCGKTTLMKIILGLVEPDHGLVFVHQRKVEPAFQPHLALQVGYVIQEGGLFPHLTAWDNVGLVPRFQGWPKRRIQVRIDDLCELVGLEASVLSQFPQQLSGGQRQRVSLMRALMMNPPFLFLDEPFGSLDPLIRYELQDEMKHIFQSLKKTVLLVTHDMSEAAFLGDTITLMNEGGVVQHGSFRDLSTHPADPFVTKFVQSQRPIQGKGHA